MFLKKFILETPDEWSGAPSPPPTSETGNVPGRVPPSPPPRCALSLGRFFPRWVLAAWGARTQHGLVAGSPGSRAARPRTTRAPVPERREAPGRVMLRHRYLLILIFTIQEKLGHRAFWSIRKDVGVGQRGRKWDFKKSVLKKITLCKPALRVPGARSSEPLCYLERRQ